MALLVAGVVLWSFVHLFPSIMPASRAALVGRLGEGPYKGIFSLLLVGSIVLMVIGWRSIEPENLYVPPLLGSPIVTVLMLISFILFAAASAPGNIKRYLRHPMLTGVIVWAIAHLLANGDNRSVVLFAGMGLWAVISIVTINRREGAWDEKPAAVPISRDIMTIVASAALLLLVAWGHRFLFGVPAVPGW